jgi:hypothetical protein
MNKPSLGLGHGGDTLTKPMRLSANMIPSLNFMSAVSLVAQALSEVQSVISASPMMAQALSVRVYFVKSIGVILSFLQEEERSNTINGRREV